MLSAGHFDQLGGDPHAIASPAHAALDDEIRPEPVTHFLGVECLASERKGRVPRDHHELPKPAQLGNDILGDPVGEIILCRIAAHVIEGQDSD